MNVPLHGIIFDMDGVLCDSEPFILQAAQCFLQNRYAISVPAYDFKPFIGAGEDRFIGGPAEKHGITIQLPQDKIATYEIYYRLIDGQLQALPGVHEFIQTLQDQDKRLAVASAADRGKVEANLEAIGLDLVGFAAVISSEDVEHKKPDPACFLTAAKAMQLPPEQCLVIEDAINGIRAAKAAGCRALALCTSFPADELLAAGADATCADLSRVPVEVMGWLAD
jgi:beta-phosphoglucomutase